ncbi:MAG: triose-phosphate isomerase [Actinomycetota bacterium]|nr:triose-phosphate isomerase [Actinomycetota bacterium]
MSRTPLVAGNWKMHGTIAGVQPFVRALLGRVAGVEGVDVVLCVPFTALSAAVAAAEGTRLEVYAQTMHQAPDGAYTGEVSAPMLTEVGVHGVVLGHSERRQLFGETDRALALKVRAALDAGLKPLLCVGETEEERDRGDTERTLRHQVQEALHGLPPHEVERLTLAYEPVWAIGTGRTATPEQAQEAVAFVRALVGDRAPEAAERVRVLYGGSVKPENAHELVDQPDVDGALVGGASLEPEALAAIVEAAAGTR